MTDQKPTGPSTDKQNTTSNSALQDSRENAKTSALTNETQEGTLQNAENTVGATSVFSKQNDQGGYNSNILAVEYRGTKAKRKNYVGNITRSTQPGDVMYDMRAHTQDGKQNRGSYQRLDPRRNAGNLSFQNSSMALSQDGEKRLNDGTNPKELLKAMSTYLNETGPGDYNLPSLLGGKIANSNKKTNPNWSFQSRNKVGWYKANNNHYLSTQSPPPNKYKPKNDNIYFKNLKYSQSKDSRFTLPTHQTKLTKQIPIQYMYNEPGHNYKISSKGIGYGSKYDFTHVRKEKETPGPKYNDHIKASLSYISENQKVNKNSNNSFYNTYDKYDKICYHGMEKHFYLRETKGPGHYMGNEGMILQSYNTKSSQYSVPKKDRQLLKKDPETTPAGAHYEPKKLWAKQKSPAYSMGRSNRDVAFSKYNALHGELVKKGLL